MGLVVQRSSTSACHAEDRGFKSHRARPVNYKSYIRPGQKASDITPIFLNPAVYMHLINDLFSLFYTQKIDKLAAIEGRGFLLAAPLALKLNIGLALIRTKGKLQNQTYSQTYIDYSKSKKTLEIHCDSIQPAEKVLLIDDWLETGSTVHTAIKLVEKCGGTIVGIGCLIDDSSDETKSKLQKYNYKYLEKVTSSDKF